MSSNDTGVNPEKSQRKVIPYELGFATFIFSVLGCLLGIVFLAIGENAEFFLDCCGIGSLVGLAIDFLRLKYSNGPFRFLPASMNQEPFLEEKVDAAPSPSYANSAGNHAYHWTEASNARTQPPPRSARAAAVDASDGFHDIPTPVPPRAQQNAYVPPRPSYQNTTSTAHERRQQEQQEKRRRFAVCFARAFLFVARADGITRPSEMAVVDRFFTQKLGFRATDEKLLDGALTEAERNIGTIDSLCADIRRELNRGEILTLFNGLYDIATIDGELSKSEVSVITQMANALGVTNAELHQIRALFIPDAPEHYALLGLMPEANVSEIKSAFHRAVLENHPDRVAHLGEQAARMATQRFLEVQKAYDAIRQERGF